MLKTNAPNFCQLTLFDVNWQRELARHVEPPNTVIVPDGGSRVDGV